MKDLKNIYEVVDFVIECLEKSDGEAIDNLWEAGIQVSKWNEQVTSDGERAVRLIANAYTIMVKNKKLTAKLRKQNQQARK